MSAKTKPTNADPLLELIRANQSELRQSVSSVIAAVQRVYLKTRHDEALDRELDRLFDSIERELTWGAEDDPAKTSLRGALRGGRVLLIVGDAGAGKTRVMAEKFRTRPEFRGFGHPFEACPLLSVVASSPFTLKSFGNEVIRKLGYHARRDLPEGEAWSMARLLFREHGIRILHIDEAQHGDQVNRDVVQKVENTLKRLLQDPEWPVWLILSGLPEVARFCQEDASMRRRISQVRIQTLSYPEHVPAVRKMVRDLLSACPGVAFEPTLTDEFVHRLMHASMFQFGIVVEFVQDALEECLTVGDASLEASHFAEAYVARSGDVRDAFNVFVAAKFDAIDVASALYETPLDEHGRPKAAKRLKPSVGRRQA